MARYARKGDGEPLLRVERPSSPSAQTTAHIISACFNDTLTRKPLDAKEINNMMVSRKGECEYHDKYVGSLKEISDNYEHQIENLRSLEQHLLQAKAKALATEEKAIVNIAETKTGLPQERCLLSQFLNEELLTQYDLLIPRQYHPKIHLPQSPPKKTFPSYLKPTVTFNLHATVPFDTNHLTSANENISRMKSKRNHGAEFEKSTMKTLDRTNSAPNNRLSNMQLSNATGQPKALKQSACIENISVHKKSFSFVAEPHEILFASYQAGQVYELPLILRNISTTSQQLRVVPPHTSYFSICIDHFPNAEGLIAPGMHCSYMVRFSPDSLADYTDHIKVVMHTGMSMSVPLKGMRPVPDLSLPCVLDCGFCFSGGVKSISFECSNNGGEGNFHFHIPQTEHMADNKSSTLQIGAFTVTPLMFHLSPGDTMHVQVCFSPVQEGEHLEDLTLVYDNCHVQCIQLRGIAEHVNVGCLSVRLSSAHEITAFKDDKIQADSFVSDCFSAEPGDILEQPVVTFDPTNPGQPIFRTATIKNFSNVDVQFQWKFYRPKTELSSFLSLSGGGKEAFAVCSTVESKCSAFSVKSQSGTLKAQETKAFVFCFLSDKAGDYEDLAHLLVLNIPELCLKASLGKNALLLPNGLFSASSLQLHGHSEHYALEFVPPIISVLEGVPFGAEVRKRFNIINPNYSVVDYCWNSYMSSISVDPPSGSIVPGSTIHCELVITAMEEGLILMNLMCSIKYSDIPLPLQVEVYVQPAVVLIDAPSLNFGLLALGDSGVLQLPIRSETKAVLKYEVRQKVSHSQDNDYMDCPCLFFATQTGELQPYGRADLMVECKPQQVGRLRSQLELLVERRPIRCVEVRAEVQRPIVHLKNCMVHEERAYVRTEVVKEVVLVNDTLIPTQFTWSSQLLGKSSNCCELKISPAAGRIGPHESLTLTLIAKWSAEGIYPECVATCIVQGMEKPLFLCVSAEVFGISVSYSINDGTIERQSLYLDFGSNNLLKKPSTMFLKVTNTSAIQTSLSLHVAHFPASKPPTPPTPKQTPGVAGSPPAPRRKQLLHQTVNMNKDHIASDYTSALLREGRGACFFIDPSSTELLPFESKTIAVTAYSDMWGEYKDELVCEVRGLAPVTIPIKYGVVGCPVVFQTTASSGQTTVRFGIHSLGSSPIHRVLKIKNPSPFAIRVDWEMFNNIQDDKLLDLIHFCGNPFPRQPTTEEQLHPSPDDASTDCQLSFRVILKPHEGVRADDPFSIHPRQMVLPAQGQGVVEITFNPTLATLHNLGQDIVSYALGYFSIDQQTNLMASRLNGYDVEPLRVNITAGITHPMLSLESDDELYFTYPASVFIQGKQLVERFEKSHHFVLKNTGTTEISFQITNELKSHFLVTTAPCTLKNSYINLKPNESIAITVSFSLSLNNFKEKCKCSGEVLFTERIIATFSNGFNQAFELSIKITAPTLVLMPRNVEFGTVFLGRSCESVILMSNTTLSDALWSLHIPSEFQCVLSAITTSGMITAQQRSENELRLRFNPSSECTYEGVICLNNELTGAVHQIKISGTGSANEKFSDMLRCT